MLFSLGNIVSSGTAQYWKNFTSFFGSAGASLSHYFTDFGLKVTVRTQVRKL
jgi:hypothetical protein